MTDFGDPRLKWLLRRVANIMGIRRDRQDAFFQKFYANEDNSVRIALHFIKEPSVNVLFFYPSEKSVTDAVSANTDLPTTERLKRKVIVAVRTHQEAELSMDNMCMNLVLMEMARGVMETLKMYCHSVYLSLLINPANQRGWSDLVQKELMAKYHMYLASLHATCGLMKGQTLLPLPAKDTFPDMNNTSAGSPAEVGGLLPIGGISATSSVVAGKDRVHVLEGAIIMWTKQIRHVLKQEPENVFKGGKNPEPSAELDFWRNRAANLNSIYQQLQTKEVKQVRKFLETNKSTYVTPFARLQKEVEDAREEANDNVRFLDTLEVPFKNLMAESLEFEKLDDCFDGVFHLILLIWKYSKYYNTFARLAVLMRQVCNTAIVQATRYISGPSVFEMIANGEAIECSEMLESVLRVCSNLKACFETYQGIADHLGDGGWKMKPATVFGRLDAYIDRTMETLDFTRTVIQFSKLERVDIGGTKGRFLSSCIARIHEEFEEAVTTFRSATYDIMDVSQPKFNQDYCAFRGSIKDLDRRLGSVLFASYEDLDTMQGRLKLFNSFEGLLERPLLQAELERKQQILIAHYREDLQEVQSSFEAHKSSVDLGAEDSPIFANMPPVAGAIYWLRSMRSRVRDPMPKIVHLNQLVRDVPDGFAEVEHLFTQVLESLGRYEEKRYQDWKEEAIDAAKQKLTMRLLRRSERLGLLKVNFDPALVRLLREVHYFLTVEGLEVPESAREIFSKADTYRRWTSQLDRIVELYNSVLTELLPVEEPLLEDRIVKMDMALAPGLTELRWRSEKSVPEFIEHAMKVVSDVAVVVDNMKGNLRKICNILSSWCKESILERKRGAKPLGVEEFELSHKARVGVRLMHMTDGGREIHRYLKDSSESLKVSKVSAPWKAYVDFVNNIVIEGFVSALAVSLQYLCEILDPLIIARHEMLPVFDVKIELDRHEIIFDPPFGTEDTSAKTTIRGTVDGWLKDFFAIATVMCRLDTNLGDYLNEIKEHFQMQCLLALVSELVDNTEMKCMEYRGTFMTHSFLWMDCVDKAFERFLSDGASDLVTGFEEEGMKFREIMDRINVDIGPPIPPLEKFDCEITRFEQMKHDLSALKTPTDIHWLRINAQPVKLSLVHFAERWEDKYTGFLKEFVDSRIASLIKFIDQVKVGLGPPSAADNPEDERLLYSTMTHIRDVKLAMNAVQSLFQPIRDQVLLLKQHRVHVSDQRLSQLEHAPAQWSEVIRAAFNEKEKILPLQSQEMVKIRSKIEGFREDVQTFRSEFLEQCPFGAENAISCDFDRSYQMVDNFYARTCDIRARADKFNDLELLFDMSMSDYLPIRECTDDLLLLKTLWDMVVLVRETFSNWYGVLWDKIDTERMMQTVKDLGVQVKSLPKGMKAWPLYTWLVDEVRNMQTALPLVNDLHSDTMRSRHWTMLMTVTHKNFEKGPDFCFRDLLELELHQFAEDVSEIVDQSAKEAKIEKKLFNIKNVWSHMTVSFDCAREDCPLLEDITEVLEHLEADSSEMMAITSQGRFIEFCKPLVDEWSEKLRTVDSVLQVWRKFQTNWCRLGPIFMQSDDIRSQLPDDSKRFELLDTTWKELMMEVSQSSHIVEICCADGREETLLTITSYIETCEKALNEYLEQKKKAFPRFYFVANQALLDILSNGNMPLKVTEYLGDVFDGIKTLDFKEGTLGRVALGHRGKCGEEVQWDDTVALEGPVEVYLATLAGHVRHMLREILESARQSADNWEMEKPREYWLEDYCAQLALLASQIIWTEETARAFEDMESGSETAMRDYLKICEDRIKRLIVRVQGPLSPGLRTKIITVITIDVHSRDVVEGFVLQKVTEAADFKWGSQLRFYWQNCPAGDDLVSFAREDQKTCVIRICDWSTVYSYEYVGNEGRLVITPLTDRCYITLTQALHLNLGGAPAGPAGTGKTETTKDLAKALGLPVVVYNCSDQMNYQTMAQIFMGLSQLGGWGCFDEFNRISIEVLSVVSTQYKSVLDAIRSRAKTFLFMDEDIRLVRTVGVFITMNPGYAGRTELPENLKALFRSVAMVVPDLRFICENMLMSEGFILARPLAFKFVTLYSLCKELLSKQMHYDWGLRAVKSLLLQAGALKRKEPNSDENPVLCRALRDFNMPKITTLDMPIFLRLIEDLFPGPQPDPFKDPNFERLCIDVVKTRGLQADTGFISKVVGLVDILNVRHCCFIIGPTGCGKTETWKSLVEALRTVKEECMWEQVNPKAITSDELYGTMSKSKEWKDGAIAVIMRNMSKELNGYRACHKHKWVILDGDIDATWIESMNTVMDDNKVLTLVSNERIPFTSSMRMLLEIQDMKHASPATVSRGGVLFINEADVGWKPYVESWRERMDAVAQSTFYQLFSNYFEGNIDHIRKQFDLSCPILDMGFVQSLTCFINALLQSNTKENMDAMRTMSTEEQKLTYEAFFTFALIWMVGGAVADDKIVNHRAAFSSFVKTIARGVKLPDQGECFDYRYEAHAKEWVHWHHWVVDYVPVADRMYQNVIVSTVDIERMKYILDLHVNHRRPVLFVGVAGTGKTTIVKDYLADVKAKTDATNSTSINLNSYTTSAALQAIIMGSLEKRSGRTYGPPAHKKCIFFIDDLNMPHVDAYDTQSAIMLLCQIFSYGQVYDRTNLDEKKDIVDVLFTACMNPKAGSFMINGRLQRRFTVLTTYAPRHDSISGIFSHILGKHLASFSPLISRLTDQIVACTSDILTSIQNIPAFLPSADKFHYQFNLKDISNIFQGVLKTSPAMYRDGQIKLLRVWLHECFRVFADRLVSVSDQADMKAIFDKSVGKNFIGTPNDEFFAQPLIMTSFLSEVQTTDKYYLPVKDMSILKKSLQDKLNRYNNEFAAMNLVLFDDAIHHVCRITRITDNSCGSALLVGVGGSGKQSLARLASFINGQEVLTILVNQQYGLPELKIDLQEFYKKAAVKPGSPQAFLMTDSQIIDERFLVYINDMLSSANIPDLFTREEYDGMFSSIRSVAKYHNFADDRDSLFQYLIDTVRRNLHLILCHSPVGSTFRIRGRKFPALISCMCIDVFHPWPRDALVGVAQFALAELSGTNVQGQETMDNICGHMAEVHLSINIANKRFLEEERRYNSTTPKSYLEFLNFYVRRLSNEQASVKINVDRLVKGLDIMHNVQAKVDTLRVDLQSTLARVDEQKESTDALIKQVAAASAEAEEERKAASAEEDKCSRLAAEAQAIQDQADQELEEALPAMEAAKRAVDCLDKTAIQELKNFTKPPNECIEVGAACGFLLKHEKRKLDWKGCVRMMNNPAQFLEDVKNFDAKEIPEKVLESTDALIAKPFFNFETMRNKSYAAACLANWVVNIVQYHKIYKKVAPLMEKVAMAKEQTAKAESALMVVKKKVQEVEDSCDALDRKLRGAVSDKERVEAQAKSCLEKLSLAERLVGGLADENDRWSTTVQNLTELGLKQIGNCLLASAFVGYVSPFSSRLRNDLVKRWRDDLTERQIPMTADIDPLTVLASDAAIAGWQNEGLPADRVSIENASVLTSCSRWPLMVDPQQQGIRWIKQRIGEELIMIQLSTGRWLERVVHAVTSGSQLLIEAIGEEVDAVLEPVLSRAVIIRGRQGAMFLKLGTDEIEYDTKFQLYLQSKLPNPHFRPEIAAQCTIINFTVTPTGLEEQILAMVVNVEKPELEQEKQRLVRQQNDFKVALWRLEDDLLSQLSAADPSTILENQPLVEGLEKTKATSKEITVQVANAQATEIEINTSRELYRPVAAEGSMLFFLVNQLSVMEHMYQYSLDSFVTFLDKAIERTPARDDVTQRTEGLVSVIRLTIFRWVNRGLFEEHKLVFCTMLTLRLFQLKKLHEEFNISYYNFLLRGPSAPDGENPLADWLPNNAWSMVQKLCGLDDFDRFAANMEKDAPNRFKEWFNELAPEDAKLPLEWKRLDAVYFQKLLVIRCLRPDRMAMALANWIGGALPNGREYLECDGSLSFYEVLYSSYEDSTNVTPIFFILSPGADPVKEVEALGKKTVQLQANSNYHNIAMGQGQDVVAMQKLEFGHKEGHWVMLQNIHLMPTWCVELEQRLDAFAAEGSHPNFRLFLSADPARGIPIGLLERSIKLTNEPPQGLLANLRRSFALFPKDDFEERDAKIKAILFGLCHFHSLMLERKKFGPLGFNVKYPFSSGDLRDSASVLYNYLEGSTAVKLPWEDLRYIFGDIMYGGHIVDNWDRKLCEAYLQYFMQDDLLDEQEMIPYAEGKLSWKSPISSSHDKYLEHIDTMPPESPLFFGMHPNAEIGFRTEQCKRIFETLQFMQPKDVTVNHDEEEGGGGSSTSHAEELCTEILDEIRDVRFATDDTARALRDEDKGPYQFVFLQECDSMNGLASEMARGLGELQLGFKGELTMSEQMEQLAEALFEEKLPEWWVRLGFPSTRPLRSWLVNLKERCSQLDDWIADPLNIPKVVDVSKLFNPQSFLTAIKQRCCQESAQELDKLQVFTEVTKRDVRQVDAAPREGAYVTGMYLEGARWDANSNSLEDSRPKEMFTRMPVVNCKAGPQSDREDKNVYVCPTYCVPTRRPYFVFAAQLRTKAPPAKWVFAGVALILDIGYNL